MIKGHFLCTNNPYTIPLKSCNIHTLPILMGFLYRTGKMKHHIQAVGNKKIRSFHTGGMTGFFNSGYQISALFDNRHHYVSLFTLIVHFQKV